MAPITRSKSSKRSKNIQRISECVRQNTRKRTRNSEISKDIRQKVRLIGFADPNSLNICVVTSKAE